MPDTSHQDQRPAAYEAHCALLAGIPGGAALNALYEHPTSFHDAIVEDVHLSMQKGKSFVRIVDPYPTIFDKGRLIVTFEVGEIIDANLDLFGENIVFSVLLGRPVVRPERINYLSRGQAREGDIELSFEASVGLYGHIVARGLSVKFSKDRRARAK